jgi:hypothetical protein
MTHFLWVNGGDLTQLVDARSTLSFTRSYESRDAETGAQRFSALCAIQTKRKPVLGMTGPNTGAPLQQRAIGHVSEEI